MLLGEEHLEFEFFNPLELGVLPKIVEIQDDLTTADLSDAPE